MRPTATPSSSGAEQATSHKRGGRGMGRAQRRAIQRVSEDRQGVWLGKDRDGTTDTSTLPVRLRVADLTTELDGLYEAKRVEQ
jgi:hypothetical protein